MGSTEELNRKALEFQKNIQRVREQYEELETDLESFQRDNPEFCSLFWKYGLNEIRENGLGELQKSEKNFQEKMNRLIGSCNLIKDYRQVLEDKRILEGAGVSLVTLAGILCPEKEEALREAFYAGEDGKPRNLEDISNEYRRLTKKLKIETENPEAFVKATELKKKTASVTVKRITRKLEVGEVVNFGRYPQTEGGKDQTPIEWQVLEVEDGKALLISRYGLDCQPYNISYTDVTWETCTVRNWLNNEFLKKAFNTREQKRIQHSTVSAEINPAYKTSSGKNTSDKAFLLSINEANRYFASNQERQCVPTAYAKTQGAYVDGENKTASGEATCSWWLRSPGIHQNYAALADKDGSVNSLGDSVPDVNDCVRPALWIDLESFENGKADIIEKSMETQKQTTGKAGSGNRGSIQGDIKAGGTVTFGRYPQTEKGNDQTPIQWRVLEVKDGRALLISEKGLESRAYNTKWEDVTWETCTLRKWLNAEFLGKAFSTEEQKRISQTRVTADKNPDYSTNSGNNTMDKVFLLSINEANRYFASNQERQCAPTAYAKAQWAITDDDYKTAGGEATCLCWLRSPGDSQIYAAFVFYDGSVYSDGHRVDDVDGCVRPALWISLE